MIEILSTPPLNTVQDLGRFGLRHYGVSTSGVMDMVACKVANHLLGNPDNAAVIEVQMFPFQLKFLSPMAFAISGADTRITLDGTRLPVCWTATALQGQVLTLEAPKNGCRAYIALGGGVDVPLLLNSRSTHLRSGFGGYQGRSLQAGDRLAICASKQSGHKAFGVVPPALALPALAPDREDVDLVFRVIKAGDYGIFPPAMQDRFWHVGWKISHQSDRGGYRLSGPPLELPAPVELRSYGLVAGIIQVPPSGVPIIQLSDANTAGGYPKMATVIDADLWRLGQARPGSMIAFKDVSHEEAVAAMVPINAYLANVERLAALYRMA